MNIVIYGREENEFELIEEVADYCKVPQKNCSFFDEYHRISNYIDCFSNEQNIYFLSVEMTEYSGFDVAKKIRCKDRSALIIFIADTMRYVGKVFEFVTFDYLVRPLNKESMKRLFLRMNEYIISRKQYFTFFSERIHHSVHLSEIIYFEKSGRSAYIHTEKESYRFNKTMHEILRQLSKEFVHIHCSYIVNLSYVKEIKQNEVIVKSKSTGDKSIEQKLPIGRSFKSNIKKFA